MSYQLLEGRDQAYYIWRAGCSLHEDTQASGSQRLRSSCALLTKSCTLAQCNVHPEQEAPFSNLHKGPSAWNRVVVAIRTTQNS